MVYIITNIFKKINHCQILKIILKYFINKNNNYKGDYMSAIDWHRHFFKMAELVASKSKDRSTKVGVVVVGPDNEVRSTGYNGFPRGINDDIEERHQRPAKYAWTEHAERNAIYHAARIGVSLKGCIMYFDSDPYPCQDCARAVIQSGIKTVIGRNIPFEGVGSQWKESCAIGKQMLEEAGVEIILLPKE